MRLMALDAGGLDAVVDRRRRPPYDVLRPMAFRAVPCGALMPSVPWVSSA
jgi:hypothetical protein